MTETTARDRSESTPEVTALVAVFAQGERAGALAVHLSCSEIDALVALLRAEREEDAAQAWLEMHAEADEEGDPHFTPTEEWF